MVGGWQRLSTPPPLQPRSEAGSPASSSSKGAPAGLDEEEELPQLVAIFWKLTAYDIQVPPTTHRPGRRAAEGGGADGSVVLVVWQETVGRVCGKLLSDNGVSKEQRRQRAQGGGQAGSTSPTTSARGPGGCLCVALSVCVR